MNIRTSSRSFDGYSARPELQGKCDQSYKVGMARVTTLATPALQLRESGNKKQMKTGTYGTGGTCGTAGTEYRQTMKIL
ncbi:MAG: hypothetical protein LBB90_06250, partial [Tannerella sp.]|nr:hypothetical protein [Tannerella sp.]